MLTYQYHVRDSPKDVRSPRAGRVAMGIGHKDDYLVCFFLYNPLCNLLL